MGVHINETCYKTGHVSTRDFTVFFKGLTELKLDLCSIFRSKDGNPFSADDIKIRCGEYDLKLGEIDQYDYQDRNVDTFTIHPFFSGMETLRNDIALIHTKESFKQAR